MQNKELIYIFFSFICILILSFLGKSLMFYGLKWHYLSTPIGLIHAYIGSDLELKFWIEYLLGQKAPSGHSLSQIIAALVSSGVSLLYLIAKQK